MKITLKRRNRGLLGGGMFAVLVFLICVFGWLTHVIVSLKAAAYLLLLVGAIFFPIGIIHGVGSWFGAF